MSRPSWHRQAGLEAAVSAVRPDLDHEVRVDMMLGIALAVPGHHIPLRASRIIDLQLSNYCY